MLAIRDPVLVHRWPASASLALDELRSARALTVISIVAPDTTIRHAARASIRTALQDVLGALLRRPAASIALISQPGQAIVLDLPGTRIGLSISHAPGLTVAAIHVGGSIGIDVMRMDSRAEAMPDWENVAQGYLGPQACRRIATLAPAQRAHAFAQAWAGWEAGLKCLGMALTEWTPALEHRLASCAVRALALPEHYCGAIATR
ncbi:MAG: 4'-phosphopantetheinyl transferase superfamily protein [Rhodoferax sp.]|nr:4'-phosphopantetheinyl transferase superfamily protein [Rhodoferax sp.]